MFLTSQLIFILVTLKYFTLITKDQQRSLDLARMLESNGHKTHFAPLFDIEYLEVNIESFDFGAVIITSSNAIKSLTDLNLNKDIEIFSVGTITGLDLRRAGFNNIKTAPDQDASSLRELIKSDYNKEQKILYICAEQVTMDFQEELAQLNIEVEKHVSYRITPKERLDNNLGESKLDYILVFSSRSARILLELVRQDSKLKEKFKLAKILCLSNKIAGEFRNSDFKKIGNFQELEILKEHYAL